jgi:hypothetical protein
MMPALLAKAVPNKPAHEPKSRKRLISICELARRVMNRLGRPH